MSVEFLYGSICGDYFDYGYENVARHFAVLCEMYQNIYQAKQHLLPVEERKRLIAAYVFCYKEAKK